MQVPLVLPTSQVAGAVDSFVQHYSSMSDQQAAASLVAGLPEHPRDLLDNSLASICHRCSYN